MNKYLIYISLPKYLQQWAAHRLGSPAVFPAGSPQNAVIRTFLRRLPDGEQPYLGGEGDLPVVIPDSLARPAGTYNHVGPMGRKAVGESIKDLFLRALWADINPLVKMSRGLNAYIDAWCENNGIDIALSDSVRQCYYRIRKSYEDSGINLRDKSRVKSKKNSLQ